MDRQQCGYHGHVCSPNVVRFISRAFNSNDYCVGGKRVSVSDDGQISSSATVLDLHAIYGYELRKYQEYLTWREEPRNEHIRQYTNAEPFDAGITRVDLERKA
jgi:hypothetical protein